VRCPGVAGVRHRPGILLSRAPRLLAGVPATAGSSARSLFLSPADSVERRRPAQPKPQRQQRWTRQERQRAPVGALWPTKVRENPDGLHTARRSL
jgi:hypothetical protein